MATEGTHGPANAAEYIVHHLGSANSSGHPQKAIVDFSIINYDTIFWSVLMGVLACGLMWMHGEGLWRVSGHDALGEARLNHGRGLAAVLELQGADPITLMTTCVLSPKMLRRKRIKKEIGRAHV